MKSARRFRGSERGATVVEFTIGALVFLTATFGLLESSRLLWTHNALSDATRRGARFAVLNLSTDEAAVKNVTVYGNAQGAGEPFVNGLDTTKVRVQYKDSSIAGVGFGYPDGSVTVSIVDFQLNLSVPMIGRTITMPDYHTTLTAESAGRIPDPVSTPTPVPTPTPAPSPTPVPTPRPTPTPAPTPTPTPVPTPTPTPTPPTCKRGEVPAKTGCICNPPMKVNGSGKCM